MAIAPTGNIFKALSFDNVSSRTYGVYITGEAVFNAPEREVEMISIPGRNGAFALDRGRFENVEVTYPAGIFAETEADFREAISEFRNFLCSRKGYVRLQDEYNPNEYRMAVYKSGLEVEPAMLKAGQFNIVFDCKPQRWLTSGETAVTIASSGDTITNPTLFESNPLLEVKGYGSVDANGYEIELTNDTVGHISLIDASSNAPDKAYYNSSLLDSGDTITLNGGFSMDFVITLNDTTASITNLTCARTQSNISVTPSFTTSKLNNYTYEVIVNYSGNLSFTEGSAETSYTDIIKCTLSISVGGASTTSIVNINILWGTNGAGNWIRNSWWATSSVVRISRRIARGELTAESTQTLLGTPTYIDCDIGEAYKMVNGEPVSLNGYIDLGSNLMKLSSGVNTFTYDNTVTELKVKPRWWKV